jgi:hypothetical protein
MVKSILKSLDQVRVRATLAALPELQIGVPKSVAPMALLLTQKKGECASTLAPSLSVIAPMRT